MAFLSVRVTDDVRNRVKAIAAERGTKLQDLVGGLVARFLEEAERRPPELGDVLRRLRACEADLRAKGVSALFVFGSVARGEARPDSDVDLAVDFAPGRQASLLTLAALKDDIAASLGRPVDLGERGAMKPRVATTAAREMVRVF
jgi:predicted nucleotidyltransferase